MAKKSTSSKKPAAKKTLTGKALKSVKGGSLAKLSLNEIKGESSDQKHKGTIEVLS